MLTAPRAAVTGLLLLAAACGSSDDGAPEAAPSTTDVTGPAVEVDVEVTPLEGGDGVFLAVANPGPDLGALGWVEEEFAVAGTAATVGDRFEPAAYRTRIVVRRPAGAADFSGTVVVEWLNVSGGLDANPDWVYLADELVRRGHAWVGVSAQRIGIEGGPVAVSTPAAEANGAGRGLRALFPERYGDLRHPGDAYSYDIYTQVGQLLRAPAGAGVLGGLEAEHVLAVGESQSAFALTTYANDVQPEAGAFDGFLIHSRGGAGAPLGEPDAGIDIASSIGGEPAPIRDDLDVPVLVLQTETDVLGFLNSFPARQPDSDRFRLWEVAGTAHADAYLVGAVADSLGCGAPVNAGPLHLVAKAALRHLDTWVRDGTPPPEAPRLEVAGGAFVRDADGIATGGIRTPLVDVPLDVLSGEAPPGPIVCVLFGSTTPLPAGRYESAGAYLDAFTASADEAIDAGFVLPDDREALLAMADPDRIPAP